MRDLEAVVDAVGLERFPLFAMSQAVPVAVAYAVRHPDRVSRMVLHGGYARGWLKRDLTEEKLEEERLMISLMRVGWGRENPAFRQVFAMQLFPEATTEELRALETQMRVSTIPRERVRLESEMHQVDVRDLAPRVQAPTLVLHSRGDQGTPFEEGRLLAALIPQAQFVALDSRNHLVTDQEPAWATLTAAMRNFLRAGTSALNGASQQVPLPRPRHSQHAVVDAQLAIDAGRVRFDRAHRDRQLIGQGRVGKAFRHQPQHFQLARRQVIGLGGLQRPGARPGRFDPLRLHAGP